MPNMKLKSILSDSDFELAKSIKSKLLEVEPEKALIILDYLHDEVIYHDYHFGVKETAQCQ